MFHYAGNQNYLNGVLKLLSNLKRDKAAGPDSTISVVLKQLKTEIAPVTRVIFMFVESGCISTNIEFTVQ